MQRPDGPITLIFSTVLISARSLPIRLALLVCVLAGLVLPGQAAAVDLSPKIALKVAAGTNVLNVGKKMKGKPGTDVFYPTIASNGSAITYGFAGESRYTYGLIWRSLRTGRVIKRFGRDYYPYALDISGSGRYVAYAVATRSAPNGYVTAMAAKLLDTRTGKVKTITRLPSGKLPKNGDFDGLSFSQNDRYVVFDSSSTQLAPPGVSVDPDNIFSGGYVFRYDRITGKLIFPPVQALRDAAASRSSDDYSYEGPEDGDSQSVSTRYPVVSADGSVVAFNVTVGGTSSGVALWHPNDGRVRFVRAADEAGIGSGESLALSADGRFLANTGFGIVVVRLGESSEQDQIAICEWCGEGYVETVDLSADGSRVAFLAPNPTESRSNVTLWVGDTGTGRVVNLPHPPELPFLKPIRDIGGMASNRASISGDGTLAGAALCSNGYRRRDFCSSRMDFFGWKVDRWLP